MADFQSGKMTTPLHLEEREIFFQTEINFPIGGQMKRHSLFHETENASVADDPGKAYSEKNLEQREFDGDAKGSKLNPSGRKRDSITEKDAVSIPQSSLSKNREP